MARAKFFKNKCLTLGQQVGLMQGAFARFERRWTRSSVNWTGEVRPSGISESYRIRIHYTLNRRPKVWVLSPRLEGLPDGEKIKHRFSDSSLCLHIPDDWNSGLPITRLVPWASLWLYHYEVWHATGKWHGGGHEPSGGK
jgi:hypothetical protein